MYWDLLEIKLKGGNEVIEGLLQIGNALPLQKDSLSNFVIELEPTKKDKQLNVLKLNFDLEKEQVLFDTKEEMDNTTAYKYNYIGSGSSRAPQWYTSSTNFNYFISETIYNLSQFDLGEDLNIKVKKVLDKFFFKLEKGLETKYSYLLDLKKYGLSNKTIEEIYDEAKNNEKIGQEILKIMSNEIQDYLKKNYSQSFKDFGLFILQIDGEVISTNPFYIKRVLESKQPKEKKDGKLGNNGVCSACQSIDNLTTDFSKTKIKLFTTNLNIFASYFSQKNYYKNMQFCESCLMKLLAAENYVMNYLNTKLSTFDVYIIPQFIYGEPLNEVELNEISNTIINSFNTVKSFDSIRDLKDYIVDSFDKNEKSYFLLNFLFYKRSQASTKVQALIKDIEPSIFDRISEALHNSNYAITDLLGDSWNQYITFNTPYFMNPIRLNSGDPSQFRDVLQTYDFILTGKKLDRRHVIKNIVECVKIIRLEKPSYNIDVRKRIEFYVIQANAYIRFLEEMKCLKEVNGLDVDNLIIKDEMKAFIAEMKYNEEQTALFLLGALIGEIGNAQYDPNSESKNKPILNKLNWNGIDKTKLVRLTKDVFAKLNQEKIRHYHEVTFGEMKRLLDKNLDTWSMNKDENLFYILSGYSYVTSRTILKGAKKHEK